MKVESIAECSPWSILQYFWPALSDNQSWKLFFCLLFEWPLKTGFTVNVYLLNEMCWSFSSVCGKPKHFHLTMTQCSLGICPVLFVNNGGMKKAWVDNYSSGTLQILWSDWQNAKATQSLCWGESQIVGICCCDKNDQTYYFGMEMKNLGRVLWGGVLLYFHTYIGSGHFLGFKILNFITCLSF